MQRFRTFLKEMAAVNVADLNTEFINQNSLSSGTYFYQLNTTNNQSVRKFLYVK